MKASSLDDEVERTSDEGNGMTHGAFNPCAVPVEVHYAKFQGASRVSECEFSLRPTRYGTIDQQLTWLQTAYEEVLEAHGLAPASCMFRRFFCSDPRNQATRLRDYEFSDPHSENWPAAISWVGQPPEPPAKVVLWAQHIDAPGGLVTEQDGASLALARGDLSHHWTANVSCAHRRSSHDQTCDIFEEYDKYLEKHRMTLANNVLRTWFFVRHVDANYQGLVVARRELFEQRGLTPRTHFIASTGIEGASAFDAAKVVMDAYAIGGVRPEQVQYVEALDHLGPTHAYGVTFERATSVSYHDRKHIFVSGTASIDPQGNILHEGDVSGQLDRVFENIEALLSQCGAGLGDMASYIAYMRDPSDQPLVGQQIRERLGNMPVAIVQGPVCRPGWLVELEGRAVVAADNPGLPRF